MIIATTETTHRHSDGTREMVSAPFFKFEAGDEVHNGSFKNKGDILTVIRRTEKSVWISNGSETYRKLIKVGYIDGNDGTQLYYEYVNDNKDIYAMSAMALDTYQVALNEWSDVHCPKTEEWEERLSAEHQLSINVK